MGLDILGWVLFAVLIVGVLALDLGVFRRGSHVVSVREATMWTCVWVTLALGFNAFVFWSRGSEIGLQFLTGYLIEYSLSVDNIFVFVLIFTYFAVPAAAQHRVLFWGIMGALVFRGLMILVGVALIKQFHWIIFIFGAFLVFTGIRMALDKGTEVDPANNVLVRFARRFIRVTNQFHGSRFFVRENGVLMATPLLLVLLVVESTDIVFAVDSIPAIFAITSDPFIIFTSNVFAILGLRSLYFLLAGIIHRFHYLKYGLAVVLTFVGVKMLLTDIYKVPTALSLGVIAVALGTSVVVSLLRPPATSALSEELEEIARRAQPPAATTDH
jgi:tellurite resistance protein TerC